MGLKYRSGWVGGGPARGTAEAAAVRIVPTSHVPAVAANVMPYATTVAASVRRNSALRNSDTAPVARAVVTVTSWAIANWEPSMPPSRNTAANTGRADTISSTMNATDATSLPQTMLNDGTQLT